METDLIYRGTPVEEVVESCFGESIFSKVNEIPKNKVIHIDSETGEKQTAGEFFTKSIQLLEGLKKHGLKQNDVIGMLCKNSFEACEILFAGILGAAPVAPLNDSVTPFELKQYYGLVKPTFIFCSEEIVDTVESALLNLFNDNIKPKIILVKKNKNSSCTHMTYEEVLIDVNVNSFHPEKVASSLNNILILPSSGTSGLPKAIGITHRSLLFLGRQIRQLKKFFETEICLQTSQFFWFSGIFSILMTLWNGNTRILMRHPTNVNLLKAIEKYKAEWTIAAPLTALAMTSDPHFKDYNVSSLKTLYVGGSTLTVEIAKTIQERLPNAEIFQLYGMTEAFGFVTYNEETDRSVGLVSPGMQVKIVDTNTGEALKPDLLGEVCVKSPGIMKCYVGNEDLTKDAIDNDGWLHSGDLGYFDKSGKLYLVDRIKEMVKVRNMQVAPAEIEGVIFSVHGVDEVGVVGLPHETDLHILVAIVVKKKGVNLVAEDIHSVVNKNLADYKKLTGGVYFVECLPKTGSGKINRRQLKTLAKELFLKSQNVS